MQMARIFLRDKSLENFERSLNCMKGELYENLYYLVWATVVGGTIKM